MKHKLVWYKSFERAFKRCTKRQPYLGEKVLTTLELLAEDPFQQRLDTHKLSGTLEGLWTCTVEYDC